VATKQHEPDICAFAIVAGGANPCFAGSSDNTATGWTAGGGLEIGRSRVNTFLSACTTTPLTETAQAVENPGDTPASFNANSSRANYNIVRVLLPRKMTVAPHSADCKSLL